MVSRACTPMALNEKRESVILQMDTLNCGWNSQYKLYLYDFCKEFYKDGSEAVGWREGVEL